MRCLDNGVMTQGFVLSAWPSNCGSSVIMTFVVNKTGIAYEKDLGRRAAETNQCRGRYGES
jgi:hypothetical protein